MKLCALQPWFVVPCATIVCVETAGLVLAVQVTRLQPLSAAICGPDSRGCRQASASGRYWKNTDPKTPWILREVVMKDGVYTPLGNAFVCGRCCSS